MLRFSVVTTMDNDDDDLWGPPFVLQEDNFRKQTLRGCEFWFDFRTDVLEENFQIERYCEQVWQILNEKKKQVTEIVELERDSMASSHDSDKTLSAAETSSAKSDLDEDENTSIISDAQTIETRDSSNDTQDMYIDTRLKLQEASANDTLTVKVAEDADTNSSSPPVLVSKIEEVEEHSCSSLVTDQVFDPIKQPSENKSSSSISRESVKGSTLKPLQDIVTASEPYTTESLLEMCEEEPNKNRETSLKTVVKDDEMIITLLTEAREKAESNTLLNTRSVLIKKRQINNTSFIRNTKQKVEGSEMINKTTPEKMRSLLDSVEQGGDIVSDLVISTSELKNKTGKELKQIARGMKITHYYKLKKEELLQQITMKLLDRS